MHLFTEQHADEAGFELLSIEACGGSSTVYKALHAESRKQVALKLLTDRTKPERIQREAKLLKRLHHPNIARFIDAGEVGRFAYLATEWVQGVPLRKQLEQQLDTKQPLPIRPVINQIQHMASALGFAHESGIVHGDINPNNILITNNSDVRIIDFGISRMDAERMETVTREIAGTPRYLAPEIIRGESSTPASDQYALALVAYEMLTGRWPYPTDEPHAATALHHQLYTQPTPASERRPDLPVQIDEVFFTALSKSPGQRFDSMQSFSKALSQAGTSLVHSPGKAPSKARRVTRRASLIATPCLIGVACLGLFEQQRIDTAQAPQLSMVTLPTDCNLYADSGFDAALENNFYSDPDNEHMAVTVNPSGLSSSPVLQLGNMDTYGTYGKIIKVRGGQRYSFSADLLFRDYVHVMELRILWLDQQWQTMEGEEDTLRIDRKFDERFELNHALAPEQAHYAVPTLYKDASAGIVYADNVWFSEHGRSCE